MGCVIIWPILFPIHATGGNGNTQLDMLSFSNVKDPKRYFAHAIMGCVFFSEFPLSRAILLERVY